MSVKFTNILLPKVWFNDCPIGLRCPRWGADRWLLAVLLGIHRRAPGDTPAQPPMPCALPTMALWMDAGRPHRRKGVQKWGHFWQKKLTFQPRQGVSNLLRRWGEGLTRKRKINVSPWNFTVTDFNAKKLLSVSCESLMKTNTASQMPSTLCSHRAPQPPAQKARMAAQRRNCLARPPSSASSFILTNIFSLI